MKKLLLAFMLCFSQFSYAQFQSPVNGVTWTLDKVGVGTSTPNSAFEVIRSGINAGLDYPCLRVTSSGGGNIYGPIIYLNAGSGTGGRSWGMVSSGALDAGATGGAGNFAIYVQHWALAPD
jgi:hypothetical protein